MRKNLHEILKNAKLDIASEYERIYTLFCKEYVSYNYRKNSIENHVSSYFKELNKDLIGRCISLHDFNETHGFCFVEYPSNFDLDYLVDFSEYSINLVEALHDADDHAEGSYNLDDFVEHVIDTMEAVGYVPIEKDDIILFVKNNPAAMSVAETVDDDLSYSVLEYDHHSLKGDLQQKKNILKNMADDIEPQRKKLERINKKFASDLFQLLNKFIRHNNDIEYIKNLNDQELEKIYDEIYQMWLLAKMQLEYYENKPEIDNVIKEISND